ncbi:MAG: aldo/keto reductase [Gammaproteobacteria bacterium]|nr:MAG: aldo/keto reductase [Gammaproteobacteria bacterium]
MLATTRRIGQTALAIPPLGFGGAPLGNLYAPLDDDTARATLAAAWEAGIRCFDTAPYYGHGLSEHRLGAALRNRPRDEYVLSTKVGRRLVPDDPERIDPGQFPGALPFRPVFDYSYDGVLRSLEDSLQRLGLHRIDIALIHDVDAWTHRTPAETDQRFAEVMAGGYRALVRLRDEGVVRAIGGGLNEWQACERFARAGDFDCFLLAGRYTLLDQSSLDSFLPLCVQRNISVIIGGPYNTGILATGAVAGAYFDYQPAPPEILARVRRIEAVCARHEVRLASAALQFPLGHPRVAAVIPGARSADEVRRNLGIFKAPVPAAFWQELRHEGLLRADAPTP